MIENLTDRPLLPGAFSQAPFGLLDPQAGNDLANMSAITLIENGDRIARSNWQNAQLSNLLRHAQARSAFWRKRLPSRLPTHASLRFLPPQTREDVRAQVQAEGSLVPPQGGRALETYATTGSTGTPVQVFVCQEAGYYNYIRSLTQYFIDHIGLEETRVQIMPPRRHDAQGAAEARTRDAPGWAGSLAKVFRNGTSSRISFNFDVETLAAELKKKAPVGHLVSPSRYVELLIERFGTGLFEDLGVKVWFHLSDLRSAEAVAALEAVGIKSLSNYSAGEIGPIAFECVHAPNHYHVAHTNVIVEEDPATSVAFEGTDVRKLLITHLHAYATPLIRYDIGDFGRVHEGCSCGHDGPTLSHIYGRGKHFLLHPDGRHIPFYLSTTALLKAATFTECRIRQTARDHVVIELGGRDSITAQETERLVQIFKTSTDAAFHLEIRPVGAIDWSDNPKRLFFASSAE